MGVREIKNYRHRPLRHLPMIAGMFAPICILINIPPILGGWANNIEDDVLFSTSSKYDPGLVIIWLLRAGLLLLILANFSLLMRFSERKVTFFTWISIASYFINTCLAISSIVFFYLKYTFPADALLPGEHYSAYASSALSFVNFLILIIDFFKYSQLKDQRSGISRNQRVLIFMCNIVSIWTVIGALVFSYFERWTFSSGIYFSIVTITAIGFGDKKIKSTSARGFNIFYATIGIVMIGMLIAFIRKVILEYFETKYFNKMAKIEASDLDDLNSLTDENISKNIALRKSHTVTHLILKNVKKLEDKKIELLKSQLNQYTRQLFFSIIALLLFWFLGAAIFCRLENWNYFTALYFCFISFTTIGYGDIVLKPFTSILVFCIYSFFGLIAMAYVVSVTIEFFSFIIETYSDSMENKHKIKSRKYKIRNKNALGTNSLGISRNIELIKALEINTGDDGKDLIKQLMIMTEFYHEEMFDLFTATGNKLSSNNEGKLNQNQLKRIEKFENIYTQLINLCNENVEPVSSNSS